MDNAFSSHCNQRPLTQDAGPAIECLTKFVNGHGDSPSGAITGQSKLLYDIRANAQVNAGGVISPLNALPIMRGAAAVASHEARQRKLA